MSGVGAVKVFPLGHGAHTVDVVITDSTGKPAGSELVQQVQTEIDPETNHGEGLGLAPIGHTVTVMGAQHRDIAVTTNITFAMGWQWTSAQSQIESAIRMYFKELSEKWAETPTTIVRIAQIETRILALECVVDITETAINGAPKNLELAEDEIPQLASVEGGV